MRLNQTTYQGPPTTKRPLLNNQAYQIFEKAGSEADLFVPGLEDHYENLAASFLEQWTHPTAYESPPVTSPAPSLTAPTMNQGWHLVQ